MTKAQLDQLLIPAAYPEKTTSVSMGQTHISFLFFTDKYVYKVKKAVNFGFLDFSSLEKRQYYCQEELRLNRRLAPDIYLDVVPLAENENGCLCFEGDGKVIEYAVKMVKMPQERMMPHLLENDQVTFEHMDKLARLVADFHKNAANNHHIDTFGSIEMIRHKWQEDLDQTCCFIGRSISEQDHQLIALLVDEFISEKKELFEERVSQGYIKECNGDLHSANICLDEPVHIFDCIEFNEQFRFSDTAADIAFLAMDLENYGRLDLAQRFLEQYHAASGDNSFAEILPLYLASRAFIRGKVESIRLDDPLFSGADKEAATRRAKRYFALARGYLLRRKLPLTLFITSAVSGCGKSVLAEELAFQLGINYFSSDIERKRLAGVTPDQHGGDIYNVVMNKATYDLLAEKAQAELAAGRSLILDATFLQSKSRAQMALIAENRLADFVIISLDCPDQVARKRINERIVTGDGYSDATITVYEKQLENMELPHPSEGKVVQLDADNSVASLLDQLLQRIIPLRKSI